MSLEHVDLPERATVVQSLRGYSETLRLLQQKKIKFMPGGGTVNVKDELKRIDVMIDRFTNKWIYLSDEVIDRTKLYAPETPAIRLNWLEALDELQTLVDSAIVVDVTDYDPFYEKPEATLKMRALVTELRAAKS